MCIREVSNCIERSVVYMFICLPGQWDIDGMGAFIDDIHKGGGFKNMRKFASKHCVTQGEKDF